MNVFLGIDYGTKRVGIAVSDESGRLAFPKKVVPQSPMLLEVIQLFAEEANAQGVVLGESRDLSGRPNPIFDEIKRFGDSVAERTGLPVAYEPEYWTSQEARKTQGMTDMNDASAAALILQRFLDKRTEAVRKNEAEEDSDGGHIFL
ncbi:MAG: pre-16S rRNA-processing nuclease YqgF [Candidatus Yonathbacteria bacterium]|nr:pre-16S rRNA-processing nuclease YqgF [Candidatus Yonathbacteria bacterium]